MLMAESASNFNWLEHPSFTVLEDAYRESDDPLAVLAAFRMCRELRLTMPEWVLDGMDEASRAGISDRDWGRVKTDHMDTIMACAVDSADLGVTSISVDGQMIKLDPSCLVGDKYERASALLERWKIYKSPGTVKKAYARYRERMREPHRYSASTSHWLIKE